MKLVLGDKLTSAYLGAHDGPGPYAGYKTRSFVVHRRSLSDRLRRRTREAEFNMFKWADPDRNRIRSSLDNVMITLDRQFWLDALKREQEEQEGLWDD